MNIPPPITLDTTIAAPSTEPNFRARIGADSTPRPAEVGRPEWNRGMRIIRISLVPSQLDRCERKGQAARSGAKQNLEMESKMRQGWIRPTVMAAVLGTVSVPSGLAWQLGSRPAEQWIEVLSRPERVERLRVDDVITRLRLKPGDTLADIGAGSGEFSMPFARTVAPSGKVYAVEVDQELVDHLRERARDEGASNVETVLGEFTDPRLPKPNIDLAFFHDVLHHVRDRAGYLKNLARYIKPEGRIAIIERGHHGPPEHGGRRSGEGGDNRPAERERRSELHMTQEQVTAWMADVGFKPAEEYYLFEGGKWFVVFARR